MYRILSAVVVALGFSASCLAEEALVTAPGVAASLHKGPLDMVAYYGPAPEGAPEGAMEVVATFAPKPGRGGHAARIAMALGEGDRVAFALPGYPATRYAFVREGGMLTVEGKTALRLALAR